MKILKRLFKKTQVIPAGSYEEINGNLLDLFDRGHFDFIAHVTNCKASMSGGIARQIAIRYPYVERADRDLYDQIKEQKNSQIIKLGKNQVIAIGNGSTNIVNMYCQYEPGFQEEYRYDSLHESLRALNNMCKLLKKTRVGLPQLGCGIGGASWDIVKVIIQQEMVDCQVTIVIFK